MPAPPKISIPLVAEALGLPETATETDVLETARALRVTAGESAQNELAAQLRPDVRQALEGLRVELLQRRDRARVDGRQAFADMTDLADRIDALIKELGL